jgi:hypothetical protein
MKVFIAAVTVAAFTASPVFASAKLLNSAPRRGRRRALNRSSYQSYSQGHQSYPNPDPELYVPQGGPYSR